MENILKDRLSMIAALGAGVVVGISGIYLYYKANRCVTQELSHLTGTIESLRREIEELKAATQKGRENKSSRSPEKKKNSSHSSAAASRYFTGYTSSLEDNDEEYFDFTDSEEVIGVWDSANGPINSLDALEESEAYLQELDNLLDSSSSDKEQVYHLMFAQKEKHADDCEFLWRLAKATHLYGIKLQSRGELDKRKDLAFEGFSYAKSAFELNKSHPEIHKWYAITIGKLGDFLGTQEKIVNGYAFKEHVDAAISLNPNDPSLHYMLGRWCYEVTSLSWIERKLASTLFSAPPESSLDEARLHLYEADRLKPDWKENLLFIAKTYISDGEYSKAISVIDQAMRLPVVQEDDEIAQKELEALESKYQIYRKQEENGVVEAE